MVNTSIQDVFNLFEEEFEEKLSKYENFFVISPKISSYVLSATVRR